MKNRLMIFDLDGTINVNPEFYKSIYSGTLEKVIEEERGKEGIEVLQYCRKNFNGKGELALFNLNIPFRKWDEKLNESSLDLVGANPELVSSLRSVNAKKVVYTGSGRNFALRILEKIGFASDDFEYVIGWREPEQFPIKWSCSSLVFEYILECLKCSPEFAYSVGDTSETDLVPAKSVGIRTVKVGKNEGVYDEWFPDVKSFIKEVWDEKNQQALCRI